MRSRILPRKVNGLDDEGEGQILGYIEPVRIITSEIVEHTTSAVLRSVETPIAGHSNRRRSNSSKETGLSRTGLGTEPQSANQLIRAVHDPTVQTGSSNISSVHAPLASSPIAYNYYDCSSASPPRDVLVDLDLPTTVLHFTPSITNQSSSASELAFLDALMMSQIGIPNFTTADLRDGGVMHEVQGSSSRTGNYRDAHGEFCGFIFILCSSPAYHL